MTIACYIEGITWAYHAEIAAAQEREERAEEEAWWASLADTERPGDTACG